jgi:hypothetical protein
MSANCQNGTIYSKLFHPLDHEHFDRHIGGNKFETELVKHGLSYVFPDFCLIRIIPGEFEIVEAL